MSSQETACTSPQWGVIPTLGKGTLGTWRFHRAARRSDTELASSRRGHGTRLWANRGSRGVCEPALKPLPSWEGPWKKGQGFKPDPGNPAVRHYRGGLGKRGYGGIVNPPRNRKGEAGNPPPVSRRARALSQLPRRVAPWDSYPSRIAG